MHCIICGNKRFKKIDENIQYSLYQCEQCKFVFKPNITINYADLGEEEYLAYNFDRKKEVKEIIGIIKKEFPSKNEINLFEIGCGTGSLLKEFSILGNYNVSGCEPSSIAFNMARSKYGLKNISNELFNSTKVNVEIDVFLLYDVIEHINNPFELFKNISNTIHKDSILVIKSGNPLSFNARLFPKKWIYFQIEQHVSFFSEISLNIILKESGLTIHKYYKFRHCYGGVHLILIIGNIIKKLLFHLFPQSNIYNQFNIKLANDHFIAVIKNNI